MVNEKKEVYTRPEFTTGPMGPRNNPNFWPGVGHGTSGAYDFQPTSALGTQLPQYDVTDDGKSLILQRRMDEHAAKLWNAIEVLRWQMALGFVGAFVSGAILGLVL